MARWREEPAGSGRWRLNLYVRGRCHKLTFYGSKKEALDYEAQRRLELGALPVARTRSDVDFKSYCVETYKPAAKAHLRPGTWKIRTYQLARLIVHFGSLKLTKIGEPEIEAYKIKRRSEGADPVTINTELNVLSATLTYARDTLRLPCAHPRIKRFVVKRKKGKVKFYSREDVALILRACREKAPRFVPLFTFLFETGARKSEAINLPWKNVIFEQRMVRIWSEADADEDDYEVKSQSGEREVPASDHLLVTLKTQKLAGLSKEWVFPVVTDREKTKGEKYVEFPSNTWDRVLKHATRIRRAPAVEAALKAGATKEEAAKIAAEKVPAITGGPHRARHTFASHFLAAKPDLFLLGKLLGHSHTRVTELYSHLIPEHLAEARNVVSFAAEAQMKTGTESKAAPRKPSLDRPRRDRASSRKP